VPIFELLQHEDKDLLMEVFSFMKYTTYEPFSTIIEPGERAHRLLVVTSGEVDVSVEQGGYDILQFTMKKGEYLGEFGILGERDWGASSLIGIQDVEVEAIANSKTFVVCLVIDADKFDRIIQSHTMGLQYMIHSYKSLRELHRQEYKAQVMGIGECADNFPADMQREEMAAFLQFSRKVLKWQRLAKKMLDRQQDFKPTVAFADKLYQLADSKQFAKQKELILEQAHNMMNPLAVEEQERQKRLLNKASFSTSQLKLESLNGNNWAEKERSSDDESPSDDKTELTPNDLQTRQSNDQNHSWARAHVVGVAPVLCEVRAFVLFFLILFYCWWALLVLCHSFLCLSIQLDRPLLTTFYSGPILRRLYSDG